MTVGSVTLTWDEYLKALDLHALLTSAMRASEDVRQGLNSSLLYRLLQYARMAAPDRTGRSRKSPGDLKWRAQLSYDLKRNVPRPEDCSHELLRLREALQSILTASDAARLDLAATLTLYLKRGQSA